MGLLPAPPPPPSRCGGCCFLNAIQYNTMRKKTKIACRGDDNPFFLPEEVLIKILVRLPVVSLLRFKSVCKSWCALIQSPFFIHLHNTFNSSSSSSSSNFGSFILRTDNLSREEDVILMLSEYEGSKSEYGDWYRCTNGSWHKFTTGGGDDQLLLKVDNLELPSCYKGVVPHGKDMTPSCNGLVCLHDFKLGDVALWNPATRQFRTLPKSITIKIDDDDDGVKYGDDFVALGFDVKTKDYKVLLITSFKSSYSWPPKTKFHRVQVYSLSTDSWRLINSTLALPIEPHGVHGLYMNGSCFFLASVYHPESNTYNRLINSFDFTKEIFTTIQLPPVHHHRQHLYLRCLGGGENMALFTTLRKTPSGEYQDHYYYDDDGYEDCDMWVLNEHGCAMSKESWTKLHSFQIKNSRLGLPIGLSNNGKFAFLEILPGSYRRRIQLYNLVTKQVKLDIPFSVMNSKVYVYKPSLVSINCGNGAAEAPGGDEVIGGAV